jgi:hypothetical protein
VLLFRRKNELFQADSRGQFRGSVRAGHPPLFFCFLLGDHHFQEEYPAVGLTEIQEIYGNLQEKSTEPVLWRTFSGQVTENWRFFRNPILIPL